MGENRIRLKGENKHMKSYNRNMGKIVEQLCDSVSSQSDSGILDEVSETADPDEEAAQTLMVLREASSQFANTNKHLMNLGHRINPKRWQHDGKVYYTRCAVCGATASFSLASQLSGEASTTMCSANEFRILHGRKASR
jgi:hypothetical protein